MSRVINFSARDFQCEGRRPVAAMWPRPEDCLLMRVLDEMDHGVLVLAVDARLIYANELALDEVDGAGPLRLRDGCIVAESIAARMKLRAALAGTLRGRRHLLLLDGGDETLSIAVTPISAEGMHGESNFSLLVFSRRSRCTALAIDFYARSKGLTGAEATVLAHLSQGLKPAEIARRQGVAMSTIRSQIASLRLKTQADSIGELLDRVAQLPPIRPVLRAAFRTSFMAATPAVVRRREPIHAAASAC